MECALGSSPRGQYVLAAAIAGMHAHARTPEADHWEGIEGLYRQLMAISSSPVIALDHVVAVAMSRGLKEGLALLEALAAESVLACYRPFYITRAELLRRLARPAATTRRSLPLRP